MDIKRLAIGTVVGAVVIYALGELFWGWLFEGFFADNTGGAIGVDRDAYVLWSLIVGTALYSLLLNFGLELRQGTASVANGLVVGAVVGALLWGTADFTLYAVNDVNNLTATVADTILEGIRGAISGAVVVLVLTFVGGSRPAAA